MLEENTTKDKDKKTEFWDKKVSKAKPVMNSLTVCLWGL